MNFNTVLFLFLFLPFFLIAYFIAQPRWRLYLGIIASLLFYAWGSIFNLFWIVALIVVNYLLAGRLETKPSKWILPLGLIINMGVLVFFKCFQVYGMNVFLGLGNYLPAQLNERIATLTFPLGLSYISFQLISYLLDVNAGAIRAESKFSAFAFYVLMFPKLLVGPIVRYRNIYSQLAEPNPESAQIANGIRRFLGGFAKKILIADTLAITINAAFKVQVEALTPLIGWLALIGYALQIYFDFSGYTDMAIGLAEMMGFHFSENFNNPYSAQSIGDFWRRWHISLSTWFRDYVFYPLERRRLPIVGQTLNILIVFLLTGLWHGVTLNFIVWGLLHGFFIASETLFLNRWLQKTVTPVRHVYALVVILFTWLIFRAPTLDYAFDFVRLLTGTIHEHVQLSFYDTSPLPFIEPSFLIAFIMGLLLCIPPIPALKNQLSNSMLLRIGGDLILITLFVLAVAAMTGSTFLPGIYATF